MLAATVALSTFLPMNSVFAEEDSIVAAETNIDYLNFLEMEDFFITAERIPVSKWETPASVTMITAEEIEANHFQDIYEALIHVNGVYFGQGLSSGNPYLNGNERVVILMDGRRSSLNAIPSMKMIERIEIVKGNGSALYGSDGVGGVVNIITKKGTRNETSIDLSTGSWHTHNYDITNQGVAGKFSWFVSGSLGRQAYYRYKDGSGSQRSSFTADRPNAETVDSNHDGLSLRMDYRFNDRNSLIAGFVHRGEDEHKNYTSRWAPKSGKVLAQVLTNNWYLTYNFKEGTSTPGFVTYFNNYGYEDNNGKVYGREQGIDYQNGWELGRHKLIAGFEWHQTRDSAERGGFSNRKRENQAYYIQDSISLDDKWTLIPGVRVDHNSQFGTHWSPKLAANYRPDDRTKIFASWGRVFKAPSAYDLYYVDEAGMMGTANPNLEPEVGHSETLGIEHDFDDRTSASLTFFNTSLRDVVDWYSTTTATNESDYTSGNISSEKQRGVEFTFRQKINDDWSCDLGYSHVHSTLDGDNVHPPKPNGYHVGIHYKHGQWRANLLAIMANRIDDTTYGTSKFATFDFNLGYAMNEHATIYFKARNFTNQYRTYMNNGKFFQVGLNCKF